MRAWAVVVAAGTGSRFGSPKQFAELEGRPVLDWSIEAARAACEGVVVVVPAGCTWATDNVVEGGRTRSESVRAGLAVVPEEAEVVVVHDAARPLAGAELWKAVIDAVAGGAEGAVPATAVTDTVKELGADGHLVTLDRSRLVAVQTPQAFRAAVLRDAHSGRPEATDDAALVESAGGRVVLVEGSLDNLKITTQSDLLCAAAIARARR